MEWISVKYELPRASSRLEYSEPVLVYESESGAMAVDSYWPKLLSWTSDLLVTHWMPLPEPPNQTT